MVRLLLCQCNKMGTFVFFKTLWLCCIYQLQIKPEVLEHNIKSFDTTDFVPYRKIEKICLLFLKLGRKPIPLCRVNTLT